MKRIFFLLVLMGLVTVACDEVPPSQAIVRIIREDHSARVWTGIYQSVRTGKCYLSVHNEGLVEVGQAECSR